MKTMSKQKGFAPLIIIGIIGLSLLAGYVGSRLHATVPAPLLGAYNVSGGGTYRLKTTAAPTDSTIQLSSFKEPISNLTYSMSYLNTAIGFGTLDPQQPTRSEFISFTGITQNSDGSASLTGVTRGLPRSPGTGGCNTASTTLEQAHAGQSIFILSDSPCLFNQFAIKQNAELISGAWQASSTAPWSYDNAFTVSSSSQQIPGASWIYGNFVNTSETQSVNGIKTFTSKDVFSVAPTSSGVPSVGSDVANKTYVDGVALAGAPNADTVTKGIVEEATVAEINASTTSGGTGAQLFVNPNILANSTFASSTIAATTSVQVLATSTLSSFPLQDNFNFLIHASTTNVISTGIAVASTQSTPICLFFNTYSPSPDSYTYTSTEIRGTTLASETSSGSNKICLTPSGATLAYKEIHITGSVMNLPNFWKYGTILAQYRGQTDVDAHSTTYFVWQSTAQVNTISLSTSSTTQGFGSSTYMSIVK